MIAPAGRVRTGGKSGSDEREFGGQGGWGGVDWFDRDAFEVRPVVTKVMVQTIFASRTI